MATSAKSAIQAANQGPSLQDYRAAIEAVRGRLASGKSSLNNLARNPAAFFERCGAKLPKGTEVSVRIVSKFGGTVVAANYVCFRWCCTPSRGFPCPKPPCTEVCYLVDWELKA
jgi:hypothetical protein